MNAPLQLEIQDQAFLHLHSRAAKAAEKQLVELRLQDAPQAWKIVEILICGDVGEKNRI